MDGIPMPEEALLLEETWAQLLGAAVTLKELGDFVATLADTMRQQQPGIAHHPPFPEALTQGLQQRQALRMTPQGFFIQGADRWFYAGLAQALGVSAEAARTLRDAEDLSEMGWFQQIRRGVDEGTVWPTVGEALAYLGEEGDR